MTNEIIKLVKAELDLRHKTKFLTVEGYVMVDSFDDKVTVSIADPQGINPAILLLNVVVEPSKGPKKQQPAPFYLREMTTGLETWTHVQVIFGNESDTMPITKLAWAGTTEITATGISTKQNLQEALDTAISEALKGTAPDAGINWTLENVSGRAGTFTGAQELTVEISFKTPAS